MVEISHRLRVLLFLRRGLPSMARLCVRCISLPVLLTLFTASSLAQHHLVIEKIPPVGTPGTPAAASATNMTIIIHGVGASDFRPALWQADTLNWVPDIQYPLLPPLKGTYRNIYSPSAVMEPWGWRVFYSGWDGTTTQNDRTYGSKTKDFVTFTDRKLVVDHGQFVHNSNVNVQKISNNSYQMLTTSWYDFGTAGPYGGREKPAVFESKNGESWNGDAIPYEPLFSDNFTIPYPDYAKAALNGANVLFQDKDKTRFLFKDWIHHRDTVFWAEGPDVHHLTIGGTSMMTLNAPNDVKKFTVNGRDWYLLALYKKGDVEGLGVQGTEHLTYSLSNDCRAFLPEQKLIDAKGKDDRYIFSDSFVATNSKILGVLYGAGSSAILDRNQVYGTWLQKRVELAAGKEFQQGNGAIYTTDGAVGPDLQQFTLPRQIHPTNPVAFDGTLNVYDDDGKTLLGSIPVHLEVGSEYRISY